MEQVKVLIKVRGGNVVAIHSNCDKARFVIVDWDNVVNGEEDSGVYGPYEADSIKENLWECLTGSSGTAEAAAELKERNF